MQQHQQLKMKTKTTPRHLTQQGKTGNSGGMGFDYHYEDEDFQAWEAIKAHIQVALVLVFLLVLLILTCYFCCGCCRYLWDPWCCAGRSERFGYTPVS
jgi:hypothetical protein